MQIDLQWFHVILTTYGAWLPGDPRGFRTREHRLHVDGDYKCPPPVGQYDRLYQAASRSLKQEVVTIAKQERQIIATAFRDRLIENGATVAIVAVLGRHAHLLAKFPPTMTRRWVGEAKKHATFELNRGGRIGRVWAAGGKFVPIDSRAQQLRVYAYIERHEQQGAYVWCYWDGKHKK